MSRRPMDDTRSRSRSPVFDDLDLHATYLLWEGTGTFSINNATRLAML